MATYELIKKIKTSRSESSAAKRDQYVYQFIFYQSIFYKKIILFQKIFNKCNRDTWKIWESWKNYFSTFIVKGQRLRRFQPFVSVLIFIAVLCAYSNEMFKGLRILYAGRETRISIHNRFKIIVIKKILFFAVCKFA